MTQILTFAIPILAGGFIGLVTNVVAIKMLFRPHTPKYIFGLKVPFTPGIIPKEKGRLAKAVGQAISTNLMNREVLEKNLQSADMVARVRTSIMDFANKLKTNTSTLADFLS